MSLYFSGKDAYNSGNYKAAQEYFQEALIKDENIEAKAQNIKYMLGVSAFNNQDYKTAKTYLILFKENPIAENLLEKITEYEKTLPEDFLYHTDNDDKQVITPVASSEVLESDTKIQEKTKQRTTVIIIVTTVIIMSLSVFFEIKNSLFSKVALKLVGVTSDTVLVKGKQETQSINMNQITGTATEKETSAHDISTASLLETPFDEEIDIEKMASKDIKEISRFFEEEAEEELTDATREMDVEQSSEISHSEMKDEEFESARDSILNSILDDDSNDLDEEDKKTEDLKPIAQKKPVENLQNEEVSKKPKYEHLDNIPDDFNVNAAIEKAFKMIEESEPLQSNKNVAKESEGFKSIEELEKEMEELEKISVDYFQQMEDIDDDSLRTYFEYIFDKHLEVSKQ